jgi:hypothetical protein
MILLLSAFYINVGRNRPAITVTDKAYGSHFILKQNFEWWHPMKELLQLTSTKNTRDLKGVEYSFNNLVIKLQWISLILFRGKNAGSIVILLATEQDSTVAIPKPEKKAKKVIKKQNPNNRTMEVYLLTHYLYCSLNYSTATLLLSLHLWSYEDQPASKLYDLLPVQYHP